MPSASQLETDSFIENARSLLVDSNLLLLFLVGSCDPDLLKKHKRLEKYHLEDFEYVDQIIRSKPKLYTTPHILTEVSNLARLIGSPYRETLTEALGQLVERMDEKFCDCSRFSRAAYFPRIGVTDSAICELWHGAGCVLTDDFALYGYLRKMGAPVVNFHHIRMTKWT